MEMEAASAPVKAMVPAPAAYPQGRWAFKGNPFMPRAVTATLPPAVQSELSLDAVTVMRNDLNDADLELVPLSKRPCGSRVEDNRIACA